MFAPVAMNTIPCLAIPKTALLPAHLGKKFPKISNAPPAVLARTHLRLKNKIKLTNNNL